MNFKQHIVHLCTTWSEAKPTARASLPYNGHGGSPRAWHATAWPFLATGMDLHLHGANPITHVICLSFYVCSQYDLPAEEKYGVKNLFQVRALQALFRFSLSQWRLHCLPNDSVSMALLRYLPGYGICLEKDIIRVLDQRVCWASDPEGSAKLLAVRLWTAT